SDAGKGGLRSGIGRFLVRRVDNKLEPRARVRFGKSEAGQCLLLPSPRWGEGGKSASPARPSNNVLPIALPPVRLPLSRRPRALENSNNEAPVPPSAELGPVFLRPGGSLLACARLGREGFRQAAEDRTAQAQGLHRDLPRFLPRHENQVRHGADPRRRLPDGQPEGGEGPPRRRGAATSRRGPPLLDGQV